jgi:hypothetical protein
MPPDVREPRPLARARLTEEGSVTTNPQPSYDEPETIAVQLRRRREAALRLPRLRSGFRDPLDELSGRRWSE